METYRKYKVAGHVFGISVPAEFQKDVYLKAYEPFAFYGADDPLFTLEAKLCDEWAAADWGSVKECFNEEAPFFWILDKGIWNFGFSYSKAHPDCVVVPSEDYRKNTVFVPAKYAKRLFDFAVSNAMMLLFTFNTTPLDTLLIHSSVTATSDGAYAFLGKSGTGKSTHSRLWLENIKGTYLLNDDNPAIRIVDGNAVIYGTPWSGKTPCYKNDSKPLRGIVRLSQAPYNKIERLSPIQAFAAFMPSCSCMKWNSSQVDSLYGTVEAVLKKVPCWGLDCLPDADAAFTCHDAVVGCSAKAASCADSAHDKSSGENVPGDGTCGK